MKQFKLCATLQFYDTFQEFLQEHSFGMGDLFLINQSLYDRFFRSVPPPCPVLVTSTYGSGEPTTDRVDRIRADIPWDTRRIIAVGGGTVMDIAKMLTLQAPSGHTADLFLGQDAPVRRYELYAVPATCGTGSEVTNACAAEISGLQMKRGLNNDLMFPAVSVLIPELLWGLSFQVFATSSIDALIHAAESFLSPKATPHSLLFSREAIRLLLSGYRYLVGAGQAMWTRYATDFLLASNYAGIAFSSAGCGPVHALSYPLGGGYHIPHGEANQLVFADTFRLYREKSPGGRMRELETLLAETLDVSASRSLEALFALVDQIHPRKPLRDYGIKAEELPVFAARVMKEQQRLLSNSYVPFTVSELAGIYQAAY